MIYSNYMREKYRNTNIPRTAEGYPCILKKSKKGNLKELVIEGNTGKNLIPYPYTTLDGVLVPTAKTESGITFTINEDRSITVNGTATAHIYYHLTPSYGANLFNLPATKYYFSDNCDKASAPKRFEVDVKKRVDSVNNYVTALYGGTGALDLTGLDYNAVWVVLNIPAGAVFDNVTYKPQLELGSTATEYEPYKAVGDLITDSDYAGKYKIPLTVHGKNLFNGYGFSAMGMITPTASRVLSNAVGTTISTTSPSNTLTVTQSNIYDSGTPNDYKNGYFCIGLNEDIKIGKRYRFYCDAEITNNPLNVSTFDLAPNNQMLGYGATYNNGKLIGAFLYAKNGNRRFLELRNRGCNMTISNIMITEINIKDTVYEPFLNPMTTSIYLDNPLGNGECLDFMRQKLIKATSQTGVALPKVQVFKGTSVIGTDTEVSPTNIKAKYIKY